MVWVHKWNRWNLQLFIIVNIIENKRLKARTDHHVLLLRDAGVHGHKRLKTRSCDHITSCAFDSALRCWCTWTQEIENEKLWSYNVLCFWFCFEMLVCLCVQFISLTENLMYNSMIWVCREERLFWVLTCFSSVFDTPVESILLRR